MEVAAEGALAAPAGRAPLRSLNLSRCRRVGDEGARALFDAGRALGELEHFGADECAALTDGALEPLLATADAAPALASLSLRGNRRRPQPVSAHVIGRLREARPWVVVHGIT